MTVTEGGPGRAGVPAVRISVITLTYRRPADLAEALPALLGHVEEQPGAELIVVDNDEQPTARQVVEQYTSDHAVRYVHEPRPGIAAARNRGLDEAAASDFVVFIDDDERAEEGWLAALLATQRDYGSTGVAGAVVSVFDGPVDPWIEAGRFFRRRRHATGTRVPVVATNNLLLDARALRGWGLRFDEAFGLSGGSDTVLSLQVGQQGGFFVWCDEAVVLDVVPPSRATRRWVLRRAFRMGNTGSRARVHVARSTGERLRVRIASGAQGAARIAGGTARMAVGAVATDPRRKALGLRTAVRGAGMLLGAGGYVYSEYARTSGSRPGGRRGTRGSISPTATTSSVTEL